MIDLRGLTGLDLELDESTALLEFGNGLNPIKEDRRTLDQMKDVLVDKDIKEPKDLYYMYRGICKQKDMDFINKHKLRFDITVIKSDKLGRESMKTAGHYHPGIYPELYEVVWGEALCLLQKRDPCDERKIIDVILVHAKKGEKIMVIPGYGHILVNPTEDSLLVTANWVSSQFNSQYEAYRVSGGAAYFVISKNKRLEFVANTFFKEPPAIRNVRPKDCIERFGLAKGEPLYSIIEKDIAKLDFLNNPAKYDFSDVFVK